LQAYLIHFKFSKIKFGSKCGLCRDASEEGVRVNISQLTPSLHFGSLETSGYRVCLRDGGFIVETEASEKVQ
jgi:hypothetical protein